MLPLKIIKLITLLLYDELSAARIRLVQIMLALEPQPVFLSLVLHLMLPKISVLGLSQQISLRNKLCFEMLI